MTKAELEQIVLNIEAQLQELKNTHNQASAQKSLEVLGMSYAVASLPEKQERAIAAELKSTEIAIDPEDFLIKFMEAMRAELCTKGGEFYEQWQKYKDLSPEGLAKQVSQRIVDMGFKGMAIASLTEAVSVCILWLGVKVFCDRY